VLSGEGEISGKVALEKINLTEHSIHKGREHWARESYGGQSYKTLEVEQYRLILLE
jgi:hypothetical protein